MIIKPRLKFVEMLKLFKFSVNDMASAVVLTFFNDYFNVLKVLHNLVDIQDRRIIQTLSDSLNVAVICICST